MKDPTLPDWAGAAAMVMGGDPLIQSSGEKDPSAPVDHGPMFDQPGVHDVYRSWHRLLAEYPGDRAMVAEACVEPLEHIADYVRSDEMHQAFNFAYLQAPWHAGTPQAIIERSFRANAAVGAPTTWVLSNHDVVRHASLLGLANTAKSPNGVGLRDPPTGRTWLPRPTDWAAHAVDAQTGVEGSTLELYRSLRRSGERPP